MRAAGSSGGRVSAVPHFLPQILPAIEVGWRLAAPFRGRGLATEAGAAALDFGFGPAGLERIVSIFEAGERAIGPRDGAPRVHAQ